MLYYSFAFQPWLLRPLLLLEVEVPHLCRGLSTCAEVLLGNPPTPPPLSAAVEVEGKVDWKLYGKDEDGVSQVMSIDS